jgi:hypothetical protein
MTASSTYGRANDVPMVNKSGGQVILGDVVIYDTTNNLSFTTTTSASSTLACGVVQETIASNGTGRVRTIGYTSLVNVNASVTRGHYGATYTVAKQATDAGASRVAGTFIYFSTGGTTPDGIVYPVDLAGAALTNPMTTGGDIIYGGASGTPTRLANGSANQVLTSAGTTLAPTWSTPSTGITLTTQGTTSAGASFATGRGLYVKKITIASACVIQSIVAFVKGDGSSYLGMNAYIYADSAGSPTNIIASSGPAGTTDIAKVTAVGILNTTVRAVTFPIGFVAAAGDYWIGFWTQSPTSNLSLAFNSGTGTDKTQLLGGDAIKDSSVAAFSGTSNDYCIYANIVR